jgi:hypothetical protein
MISGVFLYFMIMSVRNYLKIVNIYMEAIILFIFEFIKLNIRIDALKFNDKTILILQYLLFFVVLGNNQ